MIKGIIALGLILALGIAERLVGKRQWTGQMKCNACPHGWRCDGASRPPKKSKCPRCGSTDVSPVWEDEEAARRLKNSQLYDGSPMPRATWSGDYRCDDCGNMWSSRRDTSAGTSVPSIAPKCKKCKSNRTSAVYY